MYREQEYSIATALFNSRMMRWMLVVAFLALGWKVMVVTGEYLTWMREEERAEREHEALRAQYAAIEQKRALLENPDTKEQVVRQEFTLKKPGEETVIVVEGTATSGDAVPNVLPWYKKLFAWMRFGD